VNVILTHRTDLVSACGTVACFWQHVVVVVVGLLFCTWVVLGLILSPVTVLNESKFSFFVSSCRIPQLKILTLYNDTCKVHLMVSIDTGCFVY